MSISAALRCVNSILPASWQIRPGGPSFVSGEAQAALADVVFDLDTTTENDRAHPYDETIVARPKRLK
jgi:hypothetical protein